MLRYDSQINLGLNYKDILKKIRIHRRQYELADAGGLKSNYGPIMIYLLFKSINLATSIDVSNLKDEIRKATLDKLGNNVKCLLYNMS